MRAKMSGTSKASSYGKAKKKSNASVARGRTPNAQKSMNRKGAEGPKKKMR